MKLSDLHNLKRLLRQSVWLLLGCSFCLLGINANAGSLRFERIMTEQGISVAETNVITQDQTGYIWIGGSNGLVRYDGHEFKIFRNDPKDARSISNNFVWDVLVDSGGDVWIATTNGLNRFVAKTEQFERYMASQVGTGGLVNNDVYRLFEDAEGSIWVGTRHGLDKYSREKKQFFHYRHNDDDSNSLSDNSITAMYQDSLGKFWVGTAKGLNLYHPKTNSFSLFRYDDGAFYDPLVSVRDLVEDSLQNLWVATDNGLFRFNQKDGAARHYVANADDPHSLGDNRIWKLLIDRHQQLWVATDRGGLGRYSDTSDHFDRYNHNPYDNTSLASNQVRDIFEDAAGDFWVALFPSGVDFANATSALFDAYRHDPKQPQSINHDAILSIAEGPKDQIWVGTEGGLNLFDAEQGVFQHFTHKAEDPNSLSANAVLAITKDKQDDYWFGTWSGGLNHFNGKTGRFKHYLPKTNDPSTISSSYVWSLMTDSKGQIWIGTEGGALDVLDPKTGQFQHFYPDENDPNALSGGFIRAIVEDRDGDIWLATLNGLNRYNPALNQFKHYQAQVSNNSLPHNSVASLFEDAQGTLWVGTEGGLAMMDKAAETFRVFTASDGLPNNSVSGITADQQGNLWINTLSGLSRFDPRKKTFTNFGSHSGLAGNIMNRPAIYMDAKGFMLVGSTRGLTQFSPEHITDNNFVPPVVLTDFKIFNRSVDIDKNGLMPVHVEFAETIQLGYQQNMFSIDFAALNYRNSEKNQYRYRMEGFDDQWIQAGTQHTATYTNLSAGDYTFTVKGSNNSGIWNEQGKSIKFHILPPPWLTWWAYCTYAALVLLMLYLFVRSQRKKVLFEQQKVKELRKLDRLKDEFLANTSHELRTPLNGIIGLTDSLLDDEKLGLSEDVKSNLKMISNSGRRLSHLINDILDFSRIKNNGVELKLQSTDFRGLCEAVCVMMKPLAEKKSIELTVDIPSDLPTIMGDANRLEQILYNLVGNAIKFTFSGSVKVYAEYDDQFVKVFIEDTGIGIPQADLGSIFESFTQAQGHSAREYEGTGLGLAVAKNLVQLHGGQISVASEIDKGSTFQFTLKISGQEAAEPTLALPENSRLNSVVEVSPDSDQEHEVLVAESPSQQHFKFHILVVDDDAINRKVLISQLSLHNYRVTEASNGQEAVEVVRMDDTIDLVLLDVMMPRMTGYQAAKQMRAIKPVYELPIIFITAKHLASDLVAGFMAGGNDFLIKPVSKNELLQRTKTHLLLLDVTRNLEQIVEERTNTLNEARRSLEAIDNIVNNINQQHSLQGLASVLLEQSSAILKNAYAGGFWLMDERRDGFQLVSTLGNNAKNIFPATITRQDLEVTRSGTVLRSGVYILSPDQITLLNEAKEQLGSALVMAIETGEGLGGLLAFATEPGAEEFSDADRDVLIRLQGHAVSAVAKARLLETLKRQNLKLERLGFTDQLTDLNNRRHLIKYLQGDLALCRRRYEVARKHGNTPDDADLLFVLIDIDHFKLVNDTYGHNAGDAILKQFATLLKQVFRESDHIIRWGGEEFLVVVRFINRIAAEGLVERFRQLVAETDFPLPDGTIIRKTCSIGFSCYPFFPNQAQQYTWEQVVEVADMCLYAAKKSQRDAWVGVSGITEDGEQITFHELEHNMERFARSNKLEIVSSLKDLDQITWK